MSGGSGKLSSEVLHQHNLKHKFLRNLTDTVINPRLSEPREKMSMYDRRSDTGSGSQHLSLFAGMKKRSVALKWKMTGKTGSVMDTTNRSGFVMGNTYKMGPEDGMEFSATKVKTIAEDLLHSRLLDVQYDPGKCSSLSQRLSDEIKIKVKEQNYKRYKIVVSVLIGERLDQTLEYASRCIWNQETDNFASATFHNQTLFAVANVFATYYE